MRLSKLFKNAPTVNITGLSFDSRTVRPGNIYFCLPGLTNDGHDFIDSAIKNGAVCIVHSKELLNMAPGAVYIRVEDVNDAMNKVARIFYARPSDKMKMENQQSQISFVILSTTKRHVAILVRLRLNMVILSCNQI